MLFVFKVFPIFEKIYRLFLYENKMWRKEINFNYLYVLLYAFFLKLKYSVPIACVCASVCVCVCTGPASCSGPFPRAAEQHGDNAVGRRGRGATDLQCVSGVRVTKTGL